MQIWLKERQLTKYCAKRDAAIRDAIKLKKGPEEIEKIDQGWEYDVRSTGEDLDALKSSKLLRKANKCDIPHPSGEPVLGYGERGIFLS
jgi:hypothetical protein